MKKYSVALVIPIVLMLACKTKQRVDLIINNAEIYTLNDSAPKAQGMAISGNRIVAVGTNQEILAGYTSANTIDAHHKPVYPGFIDAHAHFVAYGSSLFEVDLTGCESWEEAISRVRTFAATHPDLPWILGRGWDQNKFAGKAFPDNVSLNAVFPDKPVLLARVDGHAGIANAKALQLSGIHPGQAIEGGTFETKNGQLTGLLVDNANTLVMHSIPKPSGADFTRWLLAAQKNCFEQGLTTITDCGLDYSVAMMIDSLQKAGTLQMQLYIMLSDNAENYKMILPKGPYKTDRLFINGFKLYADGALGSRGACLLEDYQDRPHWKGFLLSSPAHYDSIAAVLSQTKFQMCTHAIGDSGNRQILMTYHRYLKGHNDRRWRIEHAQVINENDFDLFGSASIIPSVQPTHATSDMYWAADRLGPKRIKGAYAYRRLLEQNGWIPLGTDFPVEDISPFKTFHSAVFRKDAANSPAAGFQSENALTRDQALHGMTIWAARADFLENEVGSLAAGKKADFIVLDRDIMKIPGEDILKTKVLATYVNGLKVY